VGGLPHFQSGGPTKRMAQEMGGLFAELNGPNYSKTTGNPLISLTGKRLGTHKSNYQDNLLA